MDRRRLRSLNATSTCEAQRRMLCNHSENSSWCEFEIEIYYRFSNHFHCEHRILNGIFMCDGKEIHLIEVLAEIMNTPASIEARNEPRIVTGWLYWTKKFWKTSSVESIALDTATTFSKSVWIFERNFPSAAKLFLIANEAVSFHFDPRTWLDVWARSLGK